MLRAKIKQAHESVPHVTEWTARAMHSTDAEVVHRALTQANADRACLAEVVISLHARVLAAQRAALVI